MGNSQPLMKLVKIRLTPRKKRVAKMPWINSLLLVSRPSFSKVRARSLHLNVDIKLQYTDSTSVRQASLSTFF